MNLSERLKNFPRLGIGRQGTPLEPMQRLTDYLGGPRLWVKREDLTGEGIGGNKLRKLDYVLHDAIVQGADTLVSSGVIQSNNQCQVAAAARKLGLDCHLGVYHGSTPAPTLALEAAGNATLNRLLGAQFHDVYWDGDRGRTSEALCASLRNQGKRPFSVPYGASNAIGAIAYASTLVEIAAQARILGINPAAIVHCSVSGATQAGLAVGGAEALPQTDIIGIDVGANPNRVRNNAIAYAKAAAALLAVTFDDSEIEVVPWQAKPSYQLLHPASKTAIELADKHEGLKLDPVFSGKGLAGLINLIKLDRWEKDSDIIFIHTGGVLSLPVNANGLHKTNAAA